MNLNPATVLDPVFHFLDEIIAEYGVYLFLAFVWLSLLVLAWIFSGGLRRKFPTSRTLGLASALSSSHRHRNRRQSYFTNTIRIVMTAKFRKSSSTAAICSSRQIAVCAGL